MRYVFWNRGTRRGFHSIPEVEQSCKLSVVKADIFAPRLPDVEGEENKRMLLAAATAALQHKPIKRSIQL